MSNWDEALSDARQRLTKGKLYVARMRRVIKLFEEKKKMRDPWPGDSARRD